MPPKPKVIRLRKYCHSCFENGILGCADACKYNQCVHTNLVNSRVLLPHLDTPQGARNPGTSGRLDPQKCNVTVTCSLGWGYLTSVLGH